MRRFLGILSFVLLWTQMAFGAIEGSLIKDVQIQGNRRIESPAILRVISSQKGTRYRSTQIQTDVRSIFRMGYFQDVQVSFNESNARLTFSVKEKTVIRSIQFSGNEEEDTEDLKEETLIKPFTYLNQGKIRRDVDALRAYYEREGYYLTEIRTRLDPLPNNEANLIFEIEENKKVEIEQIHFVGNQVFTDDQLKDVIFTKEKGFLSFLTGSGSFEDMALKRDREIVRQWYGHHGYIKARVSDPRLQLSRDKQRLSLTFVVDEGEAYKVGTVDIGGEFVIPKSKLEKMVSLESGKTVDTWIIQKDIQALSTAYMDEGYAYANVIPRDSYDEDSKTVSINYFLQPGKKVRIEEIRFTGNDTTRDKVLRREMSILEGEYYSATKIQESKANIDRLALFEEVRLTTPRASTDERVDVVIDVKEKSTGSFSIGAGFNTLESFQVIGQVQRRNLFGYGVDLMLSARLGGRTQAFNLQYRDEHFLDTKWGLTVNAFNIERAFSDFDLTSRGGTIGFDYPLYRKGLRRVRAGITYGLVDQNLSNIRSTVENLFDSGLTSSVTLSISHDTRDRVFEPSSGSYLSLTQEFAGRIFGGDNSFSKSELDARWYFPVAPNSRIPIIGKSVLAFHFGTGYVAPLRDGERVPLFERYFPGGIFTIRGFPIRSLGPEIQVASSSDPTSLVTSDFNVGGNKQVIFNAEYIFPIISAAGIKGVFFFDMGNAFDNGETPFTLAGQRQSTGFGIRWFSPIGPLRFEWGFPLDRKEDESFVAFDFTIGSLF